MKTNNILMMAMTSMLIFGCGSNDNTCADESSSVFSAVSDSSIDESTEVVESSNVTTEVISVEPGYDHLFDIPKIEIEVGETYYFKKYYENVDNVKVSSDNEEIVTYENKFLEGKNVGQTNVVLELDGKKQKVIVEVFETGYFSDNFAFNKEHLYSKSIAAFGDSVTAQATIGYGNDTYLSLFAKHFGATVYANYAIGGTTATYMYPGSNIYKEYKDNQDAIDGVRRVYRAYRSEDLYAIDYVFIAFGHNDQYFQPPISVDGDDAYCVDGTFSTCHSFKGSYRYMINLIRKANPNARIILLNCTYSEYRSGYGGKLTYQDYRNAIKEIAIEMKCRYIDPWDYLKTYYDNQNGNVYYRDAVHLTVKGHKLLADYIIKQ